MKGRFLSRGSALPVEQARQIEPGTLKSPPATLDRLTGGGNFDIHPTFGATLMDPPDPRLANGGE